MNPVERLRDFISDSLNAAAVEIFTMLERTIVQNEEHLDRQRSLQDLTGKPRRKFHGAADSEELLSHKTVRKFLDVRLSAAAVEIFSVFEQTIVHYGEHVAGRHRMLAVTEIPQIQFHAAGEGSWSKTGFTDFKHLSERTTKHESSGSHLDNAVKLGLLGQVDVAVQIDGAYKRSIEQHRRTENPQHAWIEEQLCHQDSNSSPDHKKPEAPQCKEEEDELYSSQQLELQPELKQESEPFLEIPADEEDDHSEAEADSEELFSSDQQTASDDEEMPVFKEVIVWTDPQGQLLNINWKPQIKLHRIVSPDGPQQHVCKERQLCNQERSYSMCQEEAAPPQVKEEQEEVRTTVEEEQLLLRQKTDDFIHTSAGDQSDHIEAESFSFIGGEKKHSTVNTYEKPYSCSECGKSFTIKCNLLRHQRTHTAEKQYSCSECDKSFRKKCEIISHKKTHTGGKPYSCSECGKSFRKKCEIIVHKRTHTGEKPYSCSECGKSFSIKGNLMTHKRTHTGEKPFSCSECGKSFTINASLMAHKRTHTGEKPYSCSECSKSFRHWSTLTKHKLIHTGEKPFSCSE